MKSIKETCGICGCILQDLIDRTPAKEIVEMLQRNLQDMALIQITDEKHLQYFCNGENCNADDCECPECYEPEKRGGVPYTKADLIKQICEQEYDAEVDEMIAGTDVYFTLEKVEIE
jgi:hypothetical protein